MAKWRVLLERIFRPLTVLVRSPRFSIYFFGIICFIGGLGALIPAYRLWLLGSESVTALNMYHHLATYTIVIAATAIADGLVRKQGSDEETFLLFLFIGMAISIALAIVVAFTGNEESYVKWVSFPSVLLAAWGWLSVHDSDPDLTDPDPLSPLGGEVSS